MSKPFYYLWAYSLSNDSVRLEHNEDRHPADEITHTDMAGHDTEHGFAYRIEGGWRITNDEHDLVEDPHVKREVLEALKREENDPSIPQDQAYPS